MGNVYNAVQCAHCNKMTFANGGAPIVHRADNANKLLELLKNGMPLGDAIKHFCGYCGGYTETPGECSCKHYQEQYPAEVYQ